MLKSVSDVSKNLCQSRSLLRTWTWIRALVRTLVCYRPTLVLRTVDLSCRLRSILLHELVYQKISLDIGKNRTNRICNETPLLKMNKIEPSTVPIRKSSWFLLMTDGKWIIAILNFDKILEDIRSTIDVMTVIMTYVYLEMVVGKIVKLESFKFEIFQLWKKSPT